MLKTKHIIGVLLLTIFVMGLVIIFRGPESVVEPFDETPFRDKIKVQDSLINYWELEAFKWQTLSEEALLENKRLEERKPIIKYYYNEIYKFNRTATNSQLDSIIRSEW